jgi:hypothetical protein
MISTDLKTSPENPRNPDQLAQLSRQNMKFDMPRQGSWETRGGWCVHALMRDVNLQMHQAAGFVGNLGYETRGFIDLQEKHPTIPGSLGGLGWAQWTGYHWPYDRRLQFENHCKGLGLSTSGDEANYTFVLVELRGRFLVFADNLRRTRNIEQACHITHRDYEGSSDVADHTYRSGSARLQWAQRALAGARSLP